MRSDTMWSYCPLPDNFTCVQCQLCKAECDHRQWASKQASRESLKYVLPASEPSEQGHSSTQIIIHLYKKLKSTIPSYTII